MKELKIDREKMLEAANSCGTVKAVFEKLWPEEFEPEVHDEIGSIYSIWGEKYMVVRLRDSKAFVGISPSSSSYTNQAVFEDGEFKKHLQNKVTTHNAKYLGNRRDILKITT